ncbi:Panacea domain-containing protein [Radiobacillus sp. PE A8.2]|uniref:Panacea domain-containing protein n=1 Tax=Radiobacillus sp. PE A8.2 TaxID=3380349 RepID=UPI00388F3864
MYNVQDVIDWFLSKDSMSPKKLQKLLYYAYSWTLTLENENNDNLQVRLFDERIEAWVHGPVIPSVYGKYRDYGFLDIEKNESYQPVLSSEIEDILEQVWDEYGSYTGNQLESITHQEDPWIVARGDCSPIERCTRPISDEEIFNYYIQNVEHVE